MSLVLRAEIQSRSAGSRSSWMRAVVIIPGRPPAPHGRCRSGCAPDPPGTPPWRDPRCCGKDLHRNRTAVCGTEQSVGDLLLARLAVAVVAEGRQGQHRPSRNNWKHHKEQENCRPRGWRLARLFSIQGWRFSSQSSMASISLPRRGRARARPRGWWMRSPATAPGRWRAWRRDRRCARRWRRRRDPACGLPCGRECGPGRSGAGCRGRRRHGRGAGPADGEDVLGAGDGDAALEQGLDPLDDVGRELSEVWRVSSS